MKIYTGSKIVLCLV